MVLQFKVWRLDRFKRRGKVIWVLRDVKGRIRRSAATDQEKKQLRRWYRRYNYEKNLEDLISDRSIKAKLLKAKQIVRRNGFTHQISLYGIFKEPSTGEKRYKRFEIFSRHPWRRFEIETIYAQFYRHPPNIDGGVFIVNDDLEVIPVWYFRKGIGKGSSRPASP